MKNELRIIALDFARSMSPQEDVVRRAEAYYAFLTQKNTKLVAKKRGAKKVKKSRK